MSRRISSLVVAMMLALVFMVGVASSSGMPGGVTPLTDEELSSADTRAKVDEGTRAVQRKKAEANSLPACVEITGVANSGSKQVVAGMLYRFDILISHRKSSSNECAAANVDLTALPDEKCDVKYWQKVANQGNEITVENCTPVAA